MIVNESPWRQPCFQNETKNISGQAFVMMKISCNMTTVPIILYALEGVTENLYTFFDERQRNASGGHIVFQNEAKNIARQAFVIMKISCKFQNSI